MPLEAITFVLADLETGRTLARALVCPQARYASLWWPNAPRLDRRRVSPVDWRHIEGDISVGLTPGPLDESSVLFRTLVPTSRRRSVTVQYVAGLPVEAEPITRLAERLDRLLRDLGSVG